MNDIELVSLELCKLNEEKQLKQLIPFVKVEPYKNHNLKEIFCFILKTQFPLNPEPDDYFKLDRFGVELACCDKLLESLCCFEEILKLNPNFLKSHQNLDNIKNQLVERWHFRMLNDSTRNTAFRNAIKNALTLPNEDKKVLDIGCGTGLLSLYALEAGATQLYACDNSKIMIDITKHIFHLNNINETKFKLINKHSMDLTPDEDLNGGKVDLICTEIFDSGVFGEGILQTLIHAKENLLKESGKILPQSVCLYIAGFESKSIAFESVCINTGISDLIYLKGHKLVTTDDNHEPYDTINVRQIKDFRIITKIQKTFEIDFNNLEQMKQCLSGCLEKKISLEYIKSGILDGFIVWFSLNVDAENNLNSLGEIRCDGGGGGGGSNSIGDNNGINSHINSCWDQVIFKLNHRFMNTEKIKYLNLTITCKNGQLQLKHYYNYPGKTFSVSPDIIRFINDTVYLNKLEYDMFTVILKQQRFIENVLDFSPFPYIGISLMKEKRTEYLYCSKDAQEFTNFIALCNCLDLKKIIYLTEPIEILYLNKKFDLIILQLIDPIGSIQSNQLANYELLKENSLKSTGIMIPERIELWTEIINSDWLTFVGKVIDKNVNNYHINTLINQFSTQHQLDLLTFDHEKLSNPFHLTDILLNDKFSEKLIKLKIKQCNSGVITILNNPNATAATAATTSINGILYFFKIYFTKNSESISTKRNYSHLKRACFIVDNCKCENSKVTVHFVQNQGIIKCSLK